MSWQHIDDKPQFSHQRETYGGLFFTKFRSTPANKPLLLVDFDGTLFEMRTPRFAGSLPFARLNVIRATCSYALKNDADVYVVTNQSWNPKVVSLEQIQNRLTNGINKMLAMRIPVAGVYASLGDDWYRKPLPGMYEAILGRQKSPGPVFVVGDAAGRLGDHSCSDRIFAYNIGAKFMTPEELVAMEEGLVVSPEPFSWGGLSPDFLSENLVRRGGECPAILAPKGEKPEIVVLVGLPGSGKSTFAKMYEDRGYLCISDPDIRTKLAAHSSNQSVVIDSTNPSAESRTFFVRYGRARNWTIRCIIVGDNNKYWSCARAFWKQVAENSGSWRELMDYSKIELEMPSLHEGFHYIDSVGCELDLDARSPAFASVARLIPDLKNCRH